MWWIGLSMCIIGILGVGITTHWKDAYFWFVFLLVGLVAMWAGQ